MMMPYMYGYWYICWCVLIQVDDLLYIYYFWFVNSPLLLELSPCGQVQIFKASRLMAQVSRALIRNGMGNRCNIFFHSFMYQLWNMLLKLYCCWRFNYYWIIFLLCWSLCAKDLLLMMMILLNTFLLQNFYENDFLDN